jgi:DeoD family purine-nucleoside phosphorylase
MPIHIRATADDYATAALCPGDPNRAEYLARTFLTDVRTVNTERGMLGFTGLFEGKPLSIQGVGMGGPSAAIYYEELIQLGVTRLVRVGTCGALRPELRMADVIIATAATPLDSTTATYTGGEPHAPTASYELVEAAVAGVRAAGLPLHVGPVATSDVFYDPDQGRFARLAARGHLGIEMEVATLYTVAAIRQVQAVALITVSDLLFTESGEFERISDAELRRGVDAMAEVACRVAVA